MPFFPEMKPSRVRPRRAFLVIDDGSRRQERTTARLSGKLFGKQLIGFLKNSSKKRIQKEAIATNGDSQNALHETRREAAHSRSSTTKIDFFLLRTP